MILGWHFCNQLTSYQTGDSLSLAIDRDQMKKGGGTCRQRTKTALLRSVKTLSSRFVRRLTPRSKQFETRNQRTSFLGERSLPCAVQVALAP